MSPPGIVDREQTGKSVLGLDDIVDISIKLYLSINIYLSITYIYVYVYADLATNLLARAP